VSLWRHDDMVEHESNEENDPEWEREYHDAKDFFKGEQKYYARALYNEIFDRS